MQHDEFSPLQQQLSAVGLQQLGDRVPPGEMLAAAACATLKYIEHHKLDFKKLVPAV